MIIKEIFSGPDFVNCIDVNHETFLKLIALF